MQIADFNSNKKQSAEKGLIPAFKPLAVNFEDAELDAGLTSSRAIIESWVFKTSQSKGMFQSKVYHMRFFRLNLMLEELKVFDKPDGKPKHTIELSQRVLKVESNLAMKVPAELIKKYGEQP